MGSCYAPNSGVVTPMGVTYARRPHPPKEVAMDHEATIRRIYDLINAGDIDGLGALLADDFVDHERVQGDVEPPHRPPCPAMSP